MDPIDPIVEAHKATFAKLMKIHHPFPTSFEMCDSKEDALERVEAFAEAHQGAFSTGNTLYEKVDGFRYTTAIHYPFVDEGGDTPKNREYRESAVFLWRE